MIVVYILSNSNYLFDKLVFNTPLQFLCWVFENGFCVINNEVYINYINGYQKKVGVIYDL